jgi:UPF0176 protein
MPLYNRIEGRLLREQLRKAPFLNRITLSFYRYHSIADPLAFRNELYRKFEALGVLGRIYVASEGINAQVSVPDNQLDNFRKTLDTYPFLKDIRLNRAIEDNGKSFFKLTIKVRKKIVADGLDDTTFNPADTGIKVNAAEFNRLADDPDTLIIDMRNHYESEVGRFKNAICPDVDTFREELQIAENLLRAHKDKKLLMYCTGGIRCEKASAWLKHKGFKNIFMLDGGIIEYARQVKEQGLENKFIGKNFVFDERLGERITPDIISHCHQCGQPCDDHTNCKNDGCHLLFIQCPSCAEKFKGCCSVTCMEIIALPEEQQRELRRGVAQGRKVFKKGRAQNLLLSSTPTEA